MILKLKVQYDKLGMCYKPTDVFQINDFVNFYEFKPILSEVCTFINEHAVDGHIQKKNELHFRIEKTDKGYVNLGILNREEFTLADVENFVCQTMSMTKEKIFARSRYREQTLPRSAIYAAAMYFGGIKPSTLSSYFPFDRATISWAVRATLPSSLLSKDKDTIKLIVAIADRYGDEGFIKFCGNYNPPKKDSKGYPVKTEGDCVIQKYEGVFKAKNKFKATYRTNGQVKYIGIYDTRFAAHQARERFIIENNLKQL